MPLFAQGQIYVHNFGTTSISGKPYTVAPGTFATGLASSSWTTSASGFTSLAGSAGQALSLNPTSSGATDTYTLTFNVSTGYNCAITGFSFWRQRSSTGPPTLSMTINGTSVGSITNTTTSGSTFTSGTLSGFSNLTGTVTIVLTMGSGTGGSFRLDDFTLNGSVVASSAPDIQLEGNSTVIADGSTSTSTTDNTSFGSVNYVSGTIQKTFTIRNNGSASLSLTGSPIVAISGTNASDFTVSTQPASSSVGINGTTTFIVTFDPSAVGIRSATVSISSNDPDENPYDFVIQGTGLNPEPSTHVGSFACSTTTTSSIPLSWTGAAGADGYLIKWSSVSYASITDPTDGSTSNGTSSVSVTGTSTAITGLTSGTTYYFKIYPYSNSGTDINYRTTASIPQTSCSTQAGPCLSEAFSAGTSVPSGWTFTSIGGTYTSAGNYGAASPSLTLDNTGDRIETATLSGTASELRFWIKGQGTNASSALLVEGFNGATWETIDNITNSIPTSGTTKIYNGSSSPSLEQTYVKFRFTFTKSAGNLAFDDVEVYCNAACTVPSVQASSFTSSSTQPSSSTVGWTRGNGNNVLVVARAGSAVNTDPVSGNSYTASFVFGAGSQLGTGNYVVYNGTGNSATITNLTPGTTYYFAIYEWNTANNCFNVTELTGNLTTPTCVGVTISSVTPASGPVATEVTITASSGNLTNATATFGGVTAIVVSSSSSQLVVQIPSGAVTGNLVVTTASGCPNTSSYTILDSASSGCQGGTTPSDLFISEVTDETFGSLTYVEIYNGTASAVNLSSGNYSVRVHNNGGSSSSCDIPLTGTIAAGGTFVLAIGSTSNASGVTPNQTEATCAGINNNDNVRLFKNGSGLDQFGYQSDTNLTGIGAVGYTYRRKNTATAPKYPAFLESDWDVIDAPDAAAFDSGTNYTNVGAFTPATGTPPSVSTQPSYSPACTSTTLITTAAEGFNGTGDTKELSYQWYYTAPGSANWTAVANNATYSGATTSALTISSVSSVDNYQFYCQIKENDGTCYRLSNAVLVKVSTSIWNGSSWQGGTPTSASIVTLNADYTTATNGNLEACSLTINSPATLTISADGYANIQNNLTVSSGAALDIQHQGSLVMVNDTGIVTNSGTTWVRKTSAPYDLYDYTYWSAPTNTTTLSNTFSEWNTDNAFVFNTSNFADLDQDSFDDNQDDWQPLGGTTVFAGGTGYAIMGNTGAGSSNITSSVSFSGKINNGQISVPLAMSADNSLTTGVNDDFNLIGNPYPSAISATAFITANIAPASGSTSSISGTLYFWTHVGNIQPLATNPGPDANNFNTDDYALFNLSGGTRAAFTAGASVTPSGFIASGQGFFVEAVQATNVVFRNAMRNKDYNNTQFFRQGTPTLNPPTPPHPQRDRFWLNLDNVDGMFSQQLIGYFPEATNDYDTGYDGLVSKTSNYLSFYSFSTPNNADPLRIQGRAAFDPSDVVSLGYFSAVSGQNRISLDEMEGVFASTAQAIYLEDLALGVVHNLKEAPYQFHTEAGSFESRFRLRYTANTLDLDRPSVASVSIYTTPSGVAIQSDQKPMRHVLIFDMVGRRVYDSKRINENRISIQNMLPHAAYIAQIELADGTVLRRKFIQ